MHEASSANLACELAVNVAASGRAGHGGGAGGNGGGNGDGGGGGRSSKGRVYRGGGGGRASIDAPVARRGGRAVIARGVLISTSKNVTSLHTYSLEWLCLPGAWWRRRLKDGRARDGAQS